jgi:hypothetical protein
VSARVARRQGSVPTVYGQRSSRQVLAATQSLSPARRRIGPAIAVLLLVAAGATGAILWASRNGWPGGRDRGAAIAGAEGGEGAPMAPATAPPPPASPRPTVAPPPGPAPPAAAPAHASSSAAPADTAGAPAKVAAAGGRPRRQPGDRRDEPEPGPAEVAQLYDRVGALIERLERERGDQAAAPFRQRYFAIPFADSLRRADLRKPVTQRLRNLERQLRSAL